METLQDREHEELSVELDARVIIVEDQETIANWLTSKSSACWSAGSEISGGWIELARFSPQRRGDRQTIFICSEDKANAVKETLPQHPQSPETPKVKRVYGKTYDLLAVDLDVYPDRFDCLKRWGNLYSSFSTSIGRDGAWAVYGLPIQYSAEVLLKYCRRSK